MIKRIVFLALAGLILVGCGVNCKSEPPRKAEYIQGGGYGMIHHFKIYDIRGDAGHTPGRCTNYEYITTDLYVDDFGTLTADEVIWRDVRGTIELPVEQKNNVRFYVSKDKIIMSGFITDYVGNNGTYLVK